MSKRHSFDFRQAELLADIFKEFDVDYLFIGKSGALILGFPGTTQDVYIYPKKNPENGKNIVKALKKLGFKLDKITQQAIIIGKDFVQIKSGPFDIDLVFAPDGFESYEEVKKNSVLIDKFPVAHIDDIIKSKKAANRERDILELPLLRDFADVLKKRRKL